MLQKFWNGYGDTGSFLEAKLKSFEDDEELVRYIPSKRLRGTAYWKAQQAKADEKALGSKLGGKRKAEEISPSDSELPTKKAPSDPFSLRESSVLKNRQQMKDPLFQMFRVNRLVVDKYTYLGGNDHMSITSLKVNIRWVLSGTPPLGDFADVKTISVFLVNGKRPYRQETLFTNCHREHCRCQIAVEEFQSFRQVHLPAWHQQLHEHAQEFLDQFLRQNIVKIDEIPFDEGLRCIQLPAAEKVIYMELHHHLLSQDVRIRKGKSKMESAREKRLNQTIGDSKTPEEALVKRCCHFTLDDLITNRENANQACDLIVAERQSQYRDLILDLKKNLKLARNVDANAFGDLPGTEKLKKLIKEATESYDTADGDLFYKDIGKVDLEEETKAKKTTAKRAAQAKKASKTATKKRRIDDGEDEVLTDNGDGDGESSDDVRQPWPVTQAEHVQALRNLTGHLRRLSRALISRIRSLRFFKVVRDLQLNESDLFDDKEIPAGYVCSKCRETFPSSKLSVLSICGHVACDECMSAWGRSDECNVAGRDAVEVPTGLCDTPGLCDS
ncbi:MAG: hypothetical protein M1839_006762 [Geoglossum umbratile]|nr:MAG: hypothetical protein M1839_006762 [Geoglossum umbratile]